MAITLDQLKETCRVINLINEATDRALIIDVVRGAKGYDIIEKPDANGWTQSFAEKLTGKEASLWLNGFLTSISILESPAQQARRPEPADLLEDIDSLPDMVQDILESYSLEDMTYDTCENLQAELHAVGYSIDYGLDAEPFNLRKL